MPDGMKGNLTAGWDCPRCDEKLGVTWVIDRYWCWECTLTWTREQFLELRGRTDGP